MKKRTTRSTSAITLLLLCISTFAYASWNNPYPSKDKTANYYYSTFAERPKTLDPARAYSSNEYAIIAQIYEPPLQYHYLLRPYKLIPLTVQELPIRSYYNKFNHKLSDSAPAKQVSYTVYTIKIKPNIYYQPHPAFVKDKQGKYAYFNLKNAFMEKHHIRKLVDFPQQASRELTASDYIYEIKRLASPKLQSPILGLMSTRIVGLGDYAKKLQQEYKHSSKRFLDLRETNLTGVKLLDRYTYQIKIKGKDPQFLYWLAMPFFAPVPWEADKFYTQSIMADYDINIDWFPIGTGPYMLTENNPNQEMRLERNPHFHSENYPSEGMPGDKAKGLLRNAGKPLPFIDKIIYSLEKESIPRWTKFLQGYYDNSGISSDSFDQAIQIDKYNNPILSDELKQKNIRLQTSVAPSIFYLGFNMLDNVVGGYSKRAQKLRQAISIAIDYEEFISIFANGRGLPAQSPIPPGIFGYLPGKEGINPIVFQWKQNALKRKSLRVAKKLMQEAGYANGRDIKTGKTLVLNYDVPATAGPDDKARLDWIRKQFNKIGIQLHVRATQYNRFQQKMRTGHAQIFFWGWNADYPDPENFLFMLYSKNGKVKYGGENAANYNNPEYDQLFDQMKNMSNTPERMSIIKKMLTIIRSDAPWVFAYYPKTFALQQGWVLPTKANQIANNTLKYVQINPDKRAKLRELWNQAILWPIFLVLLIALILLVPVSLRFYRMEHQPKKRIEDNEVED